MPAQQMKLDGAEDVLDKLRRMSRKDAKRVVTKGLRAGAKICAKAAKREAPKLHGLLKRSIGVFSAKRKTKGTIKISAGPRSKYFQGKFYYPGAVEAGHRVRGGKGLKRLKQAIVGRERVKANPFMERAFASSQSSAARKTIDVIEADLPKAFFEDGA